MRSRKNGSWIWIAPKCLLLNFAQKWFFKTFPFISDKNIRDHSYIREVREYCQLVFPPNGWFFLSGSLNGQNSCASLFLIAPNMPLHFFIARLFRNSQITKFEWFIWWFFKRSWLKEFTVLPITSHKVLISKRLEVEYISYCLFISERNQYKSIKNSPL